MFRIEHYLAATTDGQSRDVYVEWLKCLRDVSGKVAVIRRIARLERGNFGDHGFCRDGVWELRADIGPGYRVYYAMAGHRLVLLLGGGDKRTQDEDIKRAVAYWQDWQRRNDDEKPAA